MEKNTKSKRFNFGKIIIALLLCLFCSLSFVGCIGRMGRGGSSSNSGAGSNTGSGSGSGSGSGGTEEDDPETPEDSGPSIENFNDVFLGAIGVYEIDGSEEVFYDKHTGKLVSYNNLVERQFDVMATYIYNTLNRIYGLDSTSASFSFSNFGDSKTLQYNQLISKNANQKIIAGFSTGELENKEYLNYKNAIRGGYKLNVVDNGDETYTLTYDTSVNLTDNAWKGADYFNKDRIKKTLGYIYNNPQQVAAPNSELTFNSDGALKNYYANNFAINNVEIESFDFKTINTLGISNKFIWNVAYYLGFSMIGATNMDASINNFNTVFTNSKITKLSASNFSTLPQSLEKYKGYNLVLADLLSDIMNLNIKSNTEISVANKTPENTCFPELKKEMYIYYDKIDDLCDANNDDMNAEGGSDEDYDFSDEEGEDFDESAMDNIDVGTPFKLKRALLVPKIDISKNNISSFAITGLLLGYQAEEEGTYKVELSIGGLDKEGKEIKPTSVAIDGGTNIDGKKVIYDETYKFSEDLVDVSIELGTELSNVEFEGVTDVASFIENSFRSQTRTVNYASGGSKTIGFGYLNIYNDIFDSEGNFKATKNILELNFDYYSSSGTKLTEIPSTYLMYFYVF